MRLLTLLVAVVLTSGCSFLRPARNPMRSQAFAERGPEQARGAIVLLPGFGDRPATFEKHGFVSALRQRAPQFDIFAADAHFTYYRKGQVVERLERDVVGPLRARGYRELWLVGTSMGGMGAIAYARTHPERIQGLLLFAPYLGPRDVVEEVERSGGLCKYQTRRADDQSERGAARANFLFLREKTCTSSPLHVWLAVGHEDRLLHADKLVGEVLPPERFLTLPGGHGWHVWTPAVQRVAQAAFSQ